MDSTIERLLARGQAAGSSDQAGVLLTAPEAERIIEQLSAYSVEEVGNNKWMQQHEWIEQLNLQAHHNAQSHSDEFVVETLVTCDKLSTLVHELLVIEAWQERVFPLLKEHLANNVDSVVTYVVLYHEGSVANLLEVTLFHEHACQAASEDSLLELADWCYRKLQYLNTDAYKAAAAKEQTMEEMMSTSALHDLEERNAEVQFGTALAALTIVRYLSDYVPRLPMGLLSRMVSTNDTIMALLPLLDNPPWVRRRKGKTEKYISNQWRPVDASERLKLSQCDVQAWLTLNNLLVEPRCRAKYDVDEYRKDALLRLRRFMHELLFDQLPVLKDLQRVLDEMSLNVGGNAADQKSSRLILEQVPEIRDHILRGKNWRAIAEKQQREQFGEGSQELARERVEALRKAFEFMVDMEEGPAAADGGDAATSSGQRNDPIAAPVKISCWRKVSDKANGIWEPWCDLTMTLAADKPPDPVELSADGASVSGLRYRLTPLDIDDTRPFPSNGKVVVVHGQRSAEALLQLPEIPVRHSSEGAAALWLTVGLLATDGLALQIKLKKAEKPKERDKVEGTWYAYHAVAGAITLRSEDKPDCNERQSAPMHRLTEVD